MPRRPMGVPMPSAIISVTMAREAMAGRTTSVTMVSGAMAGRTTSAIMVRGAIARTTSVTTGSSLIRVRTGSRTVTHAGSRMATAPGISAITCARMANRMVTAAASVIMCARMANRACTGVME